MGCQCLLGDGGGTNFPCTGPHLCEHHAGTLLGPRVTPRPATACGSSVMLCSRRALPHSPTALRLRGDTRAQQGLPGTKDNFGVPWSVVP